MNKDNYRDYVTEAYRFYAMCGRPGAAELRQMRSILLNDCRGSIADLEAVQRVVERLGLEQDGELLSRCMEIVYFSDPKHIPGRGTISSRVDFAAAQLCVSESTVYRVLRRLRLMLAVERGLRVDDEGMALAFERMRKRNQPASRTSDSIASCPSAV